MRSCAFASAAAFLARAVIIGLFLRHLGIAIRGTRRRRHQAYRLAQLALRRFVVTAVDQRFRLVKMRLCLGLHPDRLGLTTRVHSLRGRRFRKQALNVNEARCNIVTRGSRRRRGRGGERNDSEAEAEYFHE